jgi:formylglycine-generating enzyme required for sulfatase activity
MTSSELFEFEIILLDAQGQVISRQIEQRSRYREPLAEGINLEMIAIPEGTLLMGAPAGESGGGASQKPQHFVIISPFWLGRYPITQAEWLAVASLPKVNRTLPLRPSNFAGDRRPVEQITWYEALEFCDRLTQLSHRRYRLPSEAEWEYACRAMPAPPTTSSGSPRGSYPPFHFGDTLTTDWANYSGIDWEYFGKVCSQGAYGQGPLGEDRRETTAVDELGGANAWGLSDLHGNVREWCQDVWHKTYEGAPTDGSAWETGGDRQHRVVRGGSWNGSPSKCRSASRAKFEAEAGFYDLGLRVVSEATISED